MLNSKSVPAENEGIISHGNESDETQKQGNDANKQWKKLDLSKYMVKKDKELVVIEGTKCKKGNSLIVDKQSMTNEEGMKILISSLAKKKKEIEGIVITDFEGTFKVDYFKRIELSLREIKTLKMIIINNSNLTREHIQILRNIIWWRREQLERIFLNKNSMDSLDFNELFVQEDFNFTEIRKLKILDIKVQPGINKLTKNQFFEFSNLIDANNTSLNASMKSTSDILISLDDTSLNNQNRKFLKQRSNSLSSIQLEEHQSDEKLFFKLRFGGCFRDKNEAAIRFLGEQLIAENFDDIIELSFKNTTLKTQDNWVPIFNFLKKTKSILNLDFSSCQLNDKIVFQLFSTQIAIKKVDLSDNNGIEKNGWKLIIEQLICHSKSVTDFIKLNKCYFQDEEVMLFASLISSFHQRMSKQNSYHCPLQKIHFNFNPQISPKGWKSLSESLFLLTKGSLETIEFRNCNIDNIKLQQIVAGMQKAYINGGALDEIVLRNNPELGDSNSLEDLFVLLFSTKMKLKKLDIGNCGILDSDFVKLMDRYSNSSKTLEQLVVKNNPNLEEKSYTALARFIIFSESSQVEKIDISNNNIKAEQLSGFIQVGTDFAAANKKNTQFKKLFFKSQLNLDDACFEQFMNLFLDEKCLNLSKLSLKHSLTKTKVEILEKIVEKLKKDNIKSSLAELSLDRNNQLLPSDLSKVLELIFLKSEVFSSLERVSLSYCNLCDSHLKEFLIPLQKNSSKSCKVKYLKLAGNTCLTSDGWMILSHILFQSQLFQELQSIDLSYCKLEQSSASALCYFYQKNQKNKEPNFKHPLRELTLNKNDLLDSPDWSDIFSTFIFSPSSQIKVFNASDCKIDTPALSSFLKLFKQQKLQWIKDGSLLKDRFELSELNIELNEGVDELTWKQFIQLFILQKDPQLDSGYNEEIEQIVKNELIERSFVQDEFKDIVQNYKETLKKFNISGKIPVFRLKELNLSGTSSLEWNSWVNIFEQLILNYSSAIEFLGLRGTFIEKKGWVQICQQIQEYSIKAKKDEKLLKITNIDFSDNLYLENDQWIQLGENIFFNTPVFPLEILSLSNCKLGEEQLTALQTSINLSRNKKGVIPKFNFKNINLSRNQIESLTFLYNKEIDLITNLNLNKSTVKLENIPKNILSSVKSLIYHNEFGTTEITQNIVKLVSAFPLLSDLFIKGNVNNFSDECRGLIDYLSQSLESLEFSFQTYKAEDLLYFLAKTNAHSTKTKSISFSNCFLLSEIDKENDSISSWETIVSQGKLPIGDAMASGAGLISIDLSSTLGKHVNEDFSDFRAPEYVLKYIAKHCSKLKSLNLANFSMSEKAFIQFCNEYNQNSHLLLTNLNVANNQQIKADSWKIFFQLVIFKKRSSFDVLNFSNNNFDDTTLSFLAEASKRASSSFKVKSLYLNNIETVSAEGWSNAFFQEFIISNDRNIEEIYLHESLKMDSQNAVFNILKPYVSNSSCKINRVHGYYEITQLFYNAKPNQTRILSLKEELKQNSSMSVREMWKNGLEDPNITRINCEGDLTEDFIESIPLLTLDFVSDLLEPMNQLFFMKQNNKIQQVSPQPDEAQNSPESTMDLLCFDYETINHLQKYFNLSTTAQGDFNTSYPYNVMLRQSLADFLNKKPFAKEIYFIPHRYFDVINSRQIYELYLQFKDTQIDTIIIDYDLRQVDLPQNLSERRLINLIRLFPPKSLELDNVSINALKAIYSILSSNNNFRYANVNFSSKSFINNGIAFSLREKMFMGKKRRNCLARTLDSITYGFLDLFCSEAEVYKFDESVPQLNKDLQKKRTHFNVMIFLTFIYFAVCISCPYLLTWASGTFDDKAQGISWNSHIIYAAFAFISFIAEVLIYRFAYHKVKHLLPPLINVDSLDPDDKSFKNRIMLFFKSRKRLLEWISYVLSLILSQFDRFDLYSDVCFVVICMKLEFYTIGFISLGVLGGHVLTNLYKLFTFLISVILRDRRRLLNTHEINQFCEISNLIEFEAVNNLLDTVAPYNISFISNNWFFNFLIPSAAGQSISNRLFHSMQKFLLEDAIQIILQLAFVFEQEQGNSTVALSIISSFVSLLKAFYKFMSIRPSTTSQLDFDYLSKTKRSKAEEYSKSLVVYRNNMLTNIKLTAKSYSPNTIIQIPKESIAPPVAVIPPPVTIPIIPPKQVVPPPPEQKIDYYAGAGEDDDEDEENDDDQEYNDEEDNYE